MTDVVEPQHVEIQLKEVKDGAMVSTGPDEEPAQPPTLRKYRRRWLVLAVVALLNNTNTISWIAFAPVGNFCNAFYGADAAAWFSMVYMIMTIPVGIFAMWAGGNFGMRTAILIAGTANGAGSIIRLISSFLPHHLRFPVGITGQAIAAVAYPFIMYLPSKVANSWFPHNQRALATMVGAMSNPLGVLLANTIAPQLVRHVDHIPLLNVLTCVPSVIALLLAVFGVNRSEPKHPPTFSASQTEMDFASGLKLCFTSRQYMLLFVVMGGGIGMFNCLYTIMQPLLCPSGYHNTFVGICAALMIVGGLVGATVASIVVDKTKLYEETMKVSMGLAVVFGLVFMQLTLHSGLAPFLALTCLAFGVLGLATYPVGLELSVECTHPVSAATATGLIVLSGQIQSVIYVMLMKNFARPLQEEKLSVQVCSIGADDTMNQPQDNTQAVMVFSVIASVLVLILVIFFKPVYRRLEAEKANRAKTDKVLIRDEKSEKGLPDQENVTQPLNAL